MTADLKSPIAATGRITKQNTIIGVFTFLQESKILEYQLATLGQHTCDPSGKVRSQIYLVTLPDQQ